MPSHRRPLQPPHPRSLTKSSCQACRSPRMPSHRRHCHPSLTKSRYNHPWWPRQHPGLRNYSHARRRRPLEHSQLSLPLTSSPCRSLRSQRLVVARGSHDLARRSPHPTLLSAAPRPLEAAAVEGAVRSVGVAAGPVQGATSRAPTVPLEAYRPGVDARRSPHPSSRRKTSTRRRSPRSLQPSARHPRRWKTMPRRGRMKQSRRCR